MRFSAVSVAFLAAVVAAAPQASVQPISQISDGQIQAPPATSAVVAPSVPAEASSVAYESSAPAAVTTPAEATTPAVVPTATPIAPTSLVAPIVPGVNSTAIVISSTGAVPSSTTGAGSSTTAGGASGSPSPSTPVQSVAAAAGNGISFGGLMVAIAAAVMA